MVATQSLTESLREALNQLYNPVFLQSSRLVQLFGLESKSNPPEALQALLAKGIKSLKPPAYSPDSCRSHRYYQVLFYRYVQQYTQADVANKVGLSARHLRREQDAAITALASLLEAQYRLPKVPAAPDAATTPGSSSPSTVERVLTMPHLTLLEHSTDVGLALETILRLTANLAEGYRVTLRSAVVKSLPNAAIPGTTYMPLVLDILTPAICSVPGGEVVLRAWSEDAQITLRIAAHPALESASAGAWDTKVLEVPQRLAQEYGGQLILKADEQTLSAEIVFPQAVDHLVLAIEDNADTLQLWTRYLLDAPYRLVGCTDPSLAIATAAKLRPSVVILDVMLPGMDGWELLGRLQYHPDTRDIPVIVCTVHPQRELALSLGASQFLAKPTTQHAFLEALEAQTLAAARQTQPESHVPNL